MAKRLSEKDRNIKQMPFRLHANDHRALKSKTALDGLKIQTLVEACVMAYLDGDDHVKKLAKEFKDLNTVNKKKASWSRRESESLLDEIEQIASGESDDD